MKRCLYLAFVAYLFGIFSVHAISDADWANAVKTHYKTYGMDTPPSGTQRAEMEQQLSVLDALLNALRRTSMGSWDDFFGIYSAKADVYLSCRQYSSALLYYNAALSLLDESLPEASSFPYRIPVLEKKVACLQALQRNGEALTVSRKVRRLRAALGYDAVEAERPLQQPAAGDQPGTPALQQPATLASVPDAHVAPAENASSQAPRRAPVKATPTLAREAPHSIEPASRTLVRHAINLYLGTRTNAAWFAATNLFEAAAAQGDPVAAVWIAQLKRLGHCGYAHDANATVGPNVIAAVRQQAKGTDALASCALGIAYHLGIGVDKDSKKAAGSFRYAAHLDDVYATYMLAVLHAHGIGVEESKAQMIEYLKQAVQQDCAKAMLTLGLKYEDGDGVTRNLTKAIEYYQRAARLHHPEAFAYLADNYSRGLGVTKNFETAFHYAQRAAQTGCALGMYVLGRMYAFGLGTQTNRTLAEFWLKRAVVAGHERARDILVDLDNVTVTCPQCNGAGVQKSLCPNCKGKGEYKCFKCEGRGAYFDDRACEQAVRGRGPLNPSSFQSDRCFLCGGDGMLNCQICGGTGICKERCEKCGGTGKARVSKEEAAKLASPVDPPAPAPAPRQTRFTERGVTDRDQSRGLVLRGVVTEVFSDGSFYIQLQDGYKSYCYPKRPEVGKKLRKGMIVTVISRDGDRSFMYNCEVLPF